MDLRWGENKRAFYTTAPFGQCHKNEIIIQMIVDVGPLLRISAAINVYNLNEFWIIIEWSMGIKGSFYFMSCMIMSLNGSFWGSNKMFNIRIQR